MKKNIMRFNEFVASKSQVAENAETEIKDGTASEEATNEGTVEDGNSEEDGNEGGGEEAAAVTESNECDCGEEDCDCNKED